MNTFTAKKIGEVIAFCRVGKDTLERSEEVLSPLLGSSYKEALESYSKREDSLIALLDSDEAKETALAKAEATSNKLKEMRDLYIGDEWDNATELMEWSGFFEGAAIVHWRLVISAAKTIGNSDIAELGDEARSAHEENLHKAGEYLEGIAKGKASA